MATSINRSLLLVCALSLVPVAARAQDRKWRVEAHVGGTFARTLEGGPSRLPGSTPLETVPFRPSRRVSSWFFGDGAKLANDAAAAFDPAFAARIVPLDSVLTDPLADRGNGLSFGFRIGRELTRRLSAEFNFDYEAAALRIPEATVSAFRATTESFQPVFRGFFLPVTSGTGSPLIVSSSSTIRSGEGGRIVATGTLNINLTTRGRVIPYATVGAGIMSHRGDTPTATLEGNYLLHLFTIIPFDESDTVRLRHTIDKNVFVGVFGGGAEFFLTSRSGIRVDVRVHLSDSRIRTLLDADPEVVTAPEDRASTLATPTDPSVHWSNSPLTGRLSSLSGPDVDDFEVIEVSRIQTSVLVSVGYFLRF